LRLASIGPPRPGDALPSTKISWKRASACGDAANAENGKRAPGVVTAPSASTFGAASSANAFAAMANKLESATRANRFEIAVALNT